MVAFIDRWFFTVLVAYCAYVALAYAAWALGAYSVDVLQWVALGPMLAVFAVALFVALVRNAVAELRGGR